MIPKKGPDLIDSKTKAKLITGIFIGCGFAYIVSLLGTWLLITTTILGLAGGIGYLVLWTKAKARGESGKLVEVLRISKPTESQDTTRQLPGGKK